jgi:GH35 family endo-1,4-beta-xylanase
MKHFYFLTLLIILIFTCGTVSAQIPAGGTSLIKETFPNYTKGGAKGTVTATTITGQTFTKGFKVVTGADISNTWDSQVTLAKTAGFEADDILLVSFFARTLSTVQEFGQGSIIVCIEDNKTYDKQTYYKVTIGSEWKQYFVPVKVTKTYALSAITYSFHTGFISQSIEVADVKFLNYKKTLNLEQLPVTPISYIGREEDAAWRAEADARINQIRKGIAEVVVYDEQGQAVKDALVTIEMENHQFGFGSAVAASRYISDLVYRKKVHELFNEVVLENDLKWPSFNPNPSLNTKRTLDSLVKHKIAIRGHNVIWPAFKYNLESLKTLSANPVAFRNEIDRHIDQVTQFTKGKLVDWDVLNEPYSEKEFMAILGNEAMADWFKRVRQNDRDVKLYINDYSILSAGGMDINHQNGYFDIIKYIDSKGGNIEGIGMQGHFDNNLTPITKVYSILDRFATLGKEIKITEHDINMTQREVQADYTRDFMTITFSHPSVKSFLTWGFWSKQHWLPEGAFFNDDWSIRPHGQAWMDLVFDKWWTKKTDLTTDSEGKTLIDGFLGSYKYNIKSGDKVRTGTFKIEHSKQSGIRNPVVLSFDTSIPDQVEITTNKSACLCEGENVTLQATTGQDLSYRWFKGSTELSEQTSAIVASQSGIYTVKVKKGMVEITSAPIEIKVTPVPQVPQITASGDLAFCPNEKVNFSTVASNDLTYNWYKGTTKIHGSVTSLDVNQSGSYSLQVNSLGCTAKSAPINVQVYSASSTECTTGLNENQESVKIYPNPFKGEFTLEISQLNQGLTKLELFNAAGACIYFQELDQISGKMIIPVANPGFYTLRITNEESVQTYKIIGN